MRTHHDTTPRQGLASNHARNGLEPGNTATLAAGAKVAVFNPGIDRTPLASGFAKPIKRTVLPAGAGFGTVAFTLRREGSFAHADHDTHATVAESAYRFRSASSQSERDAFAVRLRRARAELSRAEIRARAKIDGAEPNYRWAWLSCAVNPRRWADRLPIPREQVLRVLERMRAIRHA